MDLDVVLLGTGATSPTPARALSASLICRGAERILVDCGEGTQLQLRRSGLGMSGIGTLLLTHGHSDHYLGIPGLLKTWSSEGRDQPLTIIGPPGTWQLIQGMRGFIGHTPYRLDILEPDPEQTISYEGYVLRPVRTDHRIISYAWMLIEDARPGVFDAKRAIADGVQQGPDLGTLAGGGQLALPDGRTLDGPDYRGPEQPGRTFVISGDTAPCDRLLEAARGADLLIHEATFCEDEWPLAARSAHSTAGGAAKLAADAEVRALCLNHLSARYENEDFLAEARAIYPGVIVPRDLDRVVIPYPGRGGVRLERPRGTEPPAATVPTLAEA